PHKSIKRKADSECCIFNKAWTVKYFLTFFTEVKGKAVCLVCGAQVAVLKEYNILTKHEKRYKNLSGKQCTIESSVLVAKLQAQQTLFTKHLASRGAAVKASFVISHKIARKSKPFCDREFIKECLVGSSAQICHEKKYAFENISLSRRTVTRRIEDIATNLVLQLKDSVNDFEYFSLALDESCDIPHTAQLLIFVCGINAEFSITEELAGMRSMKRTIGSELLAEVNACLESLGLNWDKLVGMTTDGCTNLTGKKVGLLKRIQDKVAEKNPEQKLTTDHQDLSYHTVVRWLSLGKVLKSFWDLREEIQEFSVRKGHAIPQLSETERDWLADLGFTVDVTVQMNELNVTLQRKGPFVYEMYSAVKAFSRKLQLLSSQIKDNNLTHLPTLKQTTPAADQLQRFSSMLEALQAEFSRRL
uniref:Uncharacterized protein n=1 Tax=Poecilia formosa TaxID=48698 RepID=A0A087Y4L4_POEFO